MANKTLTLTVNLTFSDHADFDDNGAQEITDKVANAIKKVTDESGLTPDGYETYLREIRVTEEFSSAETKIDTI